MKNLLFLALSLFLFSAVNAQNAAQSASKVEAATSQKIKEANVNVEKVELAKEQVKAAAQTKRADGTKHACAPGCTKSCCAAADKKACAPGCAKACCAEASKSGKKQCTAAQKKQCAKKKSQCSGSKKAASESPNE